MDTSFELGTPEGNRLRIGPFPDPLTDVHVTREDLSFIFGPDLLRVKFLRSDDRSLIAVTHENFPEGLPIATSSPSADFSALLRGQKLERIDAYSEGVAASFERHIVLFMAGQVFVMNAETGGRETETALQC